MRSKSGLWPEKPWKMEASRRDPDGTWGGKAADVPCAICGERIRPDHLEYELQFGPEGAKARVDMFHLHLRCFAAWEMERTKPTTVARPHEADNGSSMPQLPQ